MDTVTIRETAIDRIEAELALPTTARPRLANRIATAENILVTQLSVANGMRPAKVRVKPDGIRSYAVRSNSKLVKGAGRGVYEVDPAGWGCICAWQRGGNSGCSRSIAAYVLDRAVMGRAV